MKKINQLILLIITLYSLNDSAQTIPNFVPSNGLVGWWPFTGSANDLSGNGNNGTVNGATLTADRFGSSGKAYLFNGTSDNISVPSATSINFGVSSFAVNVWVKFVANYSSNINPHGIVTKSVPTGGTPPLDGWQLMTTNNVIYTEFALTGYGTCGYSCSNSLFDNNWHMITWMVNRSASTFSYYLDGVFTNSVICGPSVGGISNNYPLRFGAEREFATPLFFGGYIDDIGMWNRILTVCEINKLYTSSSTFMNVSASNTAICLGQYATLAASGANTYTWSNSYQTPNISVNPSVTTTYSITGTNSVGCVEISTLQIMVLQNPTIIAAATNSTMCIGESNTIIASGASTYSWNTGATSSTFVIIPSVVTTINYSVLGISSEGCKNTATIQVKINACTGFNSISQESGEIFIFPNPNNGEFKIQSQGPIDLKLINSVGQVIREIMLVKRNNFEINIDGLVNGIYFVKGINREKEFNFKILVNN